MSEGDQVLNCWDNKIAVKRKNGDVDIFQIAIKENNLPTLSPDQWRITYGNNTIDIIDKDDNSKSNGKGKRQQKNNESSKSSVPPDTNGTALSPDNEVIDNEDDDADFEMSIRPNKKG